MPETSGQHPVEQDQVGQLFLHAVGGVVAGFGGDDAEAFGFEIVAQQDRQVFFVLNDENRGWHGS